MSRLVLAKVGVALCLSTSLCLDASFVLAHGTPHETLDQDLGQVASDYIWFLKIVAEELETRNSVDSLSSIQVADFRFKKSTNPSMAFLYKAFEKFKNQKRENFFEKTKEEQEQEITFINQSLFKLALFSGEATEMSARFGFIFVAGWGLWEIFEHFILVGVPPGTLCWAFPFIWSATIAPLMAPFQNFFYKPEPISFLKRLKLSFFLPSRQQSNRSLTREVIFDDHIPISQKGFLSLEDYETPLEKLLAGTGLWPEVFSFYRSDHFTKASDVRTETHLDDFFEIILRGESVKDKKLAVRRIEDLYTALVLTTTATSKLLYQSRSLSFRHFLKFSRISGAFIKVLDSFFKILFILSENKDLKHAKEHQMAMQQISNKTNEILSQLALVLEHYEADKFSKQVEAIKLEIKKLKFEVSNMKKGLHTCSYSLQELLSSSI